MKRGIALLVFIAAMIGHAGGGGDENGTAAKVPSYQARGVMMQKTRQQLGRGVGVALAAFICSSSRQPRGAIANPRSFKDGDAGPQLS